MRHVILLLALAGSALFVAPAAGQEASDVTFEGEVAETSGAVSPTSGATVGPGFIRITLTPSMDGILRVEIADVRTFAARISPSASWEQRLSDERYYWPPLPIEDGRFALWMWISPHIGSATRVSVNIEGELVSGSELRGTLQHSWIEPVVTTWGATTPADTPPGAQDLLFDTLVEGGGHLEVALTEDGLSVTSFDLQELQLDPCFPGETLSVRAFFDPGVDLDQAVAIVAGDYGLSEVGIDVEEAAGSRASGTLYFVAGFPWIDCRFNVRWQTVLTPTAEPTATPQPTATALATPVEAPTELPIAGVGGARGVPSAGLAILAACLGAALAAVGLFRMRA